MNKPNGKVYILPQATKFKICKIYSHNYSRGVFCTPNRTAIDFTPNNYVLTTAITAPLSKVLVDTSIIG